ncbi:hypothetical protein ACET3X_004760 [Alternaria dauci]|uniref:Uncharacterized protein n=1 Tax=Alternaria dauci TaxID=48095 RepID=A0ABR3UJM3_9PLEO
MVKGSDIVPMDQSDLLLTSLQDAPFVDDWNYTSPSPDTWKTQLFKAKIQSREYASGGVDDASKGWLVTLISTLLVNILMLVYFVLQPGLVTDFSQSPQLFALAVNSPPTPAFAGSCGGGPEGKEYKLAWSISHEGGHVFIEPESQRKPASFADDFDASCNPAHHQTAATRGSGLPSTMSAAWDYIKFNPNPRSKELRRGGLASGTEPLRPSHTTQRVSSLHSQYELGDVEPRK